MMPLRVTDLCRKSQEVVQSQLENAGINTTLFDGRNLQLLGGVGPVILPNNDESEGSSNSDDDNELGKTSLTAAGEVSLDTVEESGTELHSTEPQLLEGSLDDPEANENPNVSTFRSNPSSESAVVGMETTEESDFPHSTLTQPDSSVDGEFESVHDDMVNEESVMDPSDSASSYLTTASNKDDNESGSNISSAYSTLRPSLSVESTETATSTEDGSTNSDSSILVQKDDTGESDLKTVELTLQPGMNAYAPTMQPSTHGHPNHAPGKALASERCSKGFFSCQVRNHTHSTGLLLFVLGAFFYYCYRCFRGSNDGIERGHYRAVAAHYTANSFDDTFDDDLSYEEIDLAYNHENGTGVSGMNTSKKRGVLEMKELDREEENGGLTLQEMNG